MTISIHVPSPLEAARAVELAASMHSESDYADLPYDKLVTLNHVLEPSEVSPYIALVATNDEKEVIGFMFGIITPFFFNDMLVANDLAVFVQQNNRGYVIAKMLIEAFEEEAKRRGAVRIYLGSTTGVQPERTLQLYEKLGYSYIGGIVRKRI